VEKTVDLAILNNVYGQTDGAAEATFLFHDGSNEIEVPWADTGGNDDRLSAISVFDTKSAQLWRDNLDGRRDDQDEEIGWSRSGEDGLWIDALQGVFSPLSRRVKQACL
jgi:hypothetical protein